MTLCFFLLQNDRLYAAQKPLPVDDKDGHYIIRPDDELGDTRRYKIIRLLGQGTFGKVVEAWDRDMRMKVAVKIIRAIQKYRDASKVEIKVLNLLRERDPRNDNKCIHLLDCFDHKNHICIVTKLLSCSVFDFLKDNNYLSFPMAHIQSFAKQLLLSVAFLHDLRLVHTDLKPENILLVNNDFGSIPIKPPKNNPGLKVKKVLKDPSVHLIDFGSATFEEEYHASVVSTRHYRAPEIILGLGWSYPCDVWSIGCILVEFFTGEALFQTHENLEHLAMMEVVFGPMPNNRFGKTGVRSKPEWFSGSTTKVNYPLPTTSRQSKKYVKAMRPLETIIPPVNIVHSRFLDLLNHLLKWDPAERYTVKEALRHPFFSIEINDEEVNQIR
ncbi:kinase-like protein [Cystobasidium minutum MCA 4210]|uniref:kinase-like protein n=1 Tax=Cystobasidium minutum MCA 4210 TaxID=1397322 RepID=UPI0034CE5ABA|eukprot:jgi/Rhomi1/141225/e_gw1.2.259.1